MSRARRGSLDELLRVKIALLRQAGPGKAVRIDEASGRSIASKVCELRKKDHPDYSDIRVTVMAEDGAAYIYLGVGGQDDGIPFPPVNVGNQKGQ